MNFDLENYYKENQYYKGVYLGTVYHSAPPKKSFIPFLLGAIGVISILFGLLFLGNTIRISMNSVSVTATISSIQTTYSDGDTRYKAYVDFEYDGETYTDIPLSHWDSGMYEGKEITLKINPENPTETSGGEWIVVLFFVLFGAIFLFASFQVGDSSFGSFGHKKSKALIKKGTRIQAEIADISRYEESEESIEEYGENEEREVWYEIICSWKSSSDLQNYTFESDTLRFDPKEILEKYSIKRLDVYYNPKNMEEYLVNLTPIIEHADEKTL